MLRKLDDMWSLPDLAYTLKPIIPDRSLILVYGHPGLGKSTLVLQLLMHVAGGVPWLGHRPRQGPTINVWVEGHYVDIKKRHDAAIQEMGGVCPGDYYWEDTAVDLCSPDAVETFMERVDALDIHPRVVSFDSLNQCMPGGDENSGTDMGQVITSCKTLQDNWDCSVILVHHPKKGEGELAERGHSALKAGIDVQVVVKGSDRNPIVRLSSNKVRGGPPFDLKMKRVLVRTPFGEGDDCLSVVLKELKAGEGPQAPTPGPQGGRPQMLSPEQVLDFVTKHPNLTQAQVSEEIGLKPRTVRMKIAQAKAKG